MSIPIIEVEPQCRITHIARNPICHVPTVLSTTNAANTAQQAHPQGVLVTYPEWPPAAHGITGQMVRVPRPGELRAASPHRSHLGDLFVMRCCPEKCAGDQRRRHAYINSSIQSTV